MTGVQTSALPIFQRLVTKTLYIGGFAFIIGNFQSLATIMLESFAGLGLKASGGALAIGDFMRPGVVAETGLDAAQPLLDASADLVGPVGQIGRASCRERVCQYV